jgi:hypothetical protein
VGRGVKELRVDILRERRLTIQIQLREDDADVIHYINRSLCVGGGRTKRASAPAEENDSFESGRLAIQQIRHNYADL